MLIINQDAIVRCVDKTCSLLDLPNFDNSTTDVCIEDRETVRDAKLCRAIGDEGVVPSLSTVRFSCFDDSTQLIGSETTYCYEGG